MTTLTEPVRLTRFFGSLALAAALVTSCTAIYNGGSAQCDTTDDCHGKGAEFAKSICNADHVCAVLGASLGVGCTVDTDCQSFLCTGEVCTKNCTSPGDCTAPTTCTSRKLCEVPLGAGFSFAGVPQDQGWTFTHELGRQAAIANLPYLTTDFVQRANTPELVDKASNTFFDEKKFEIIVGTSTSERKTLFGIAAARPDKKIFIFAGPGAATYTQPNVYAKFARMEQAFYLAGIAAAKLSKTKRLGFIGGFITPQVVRHGNAFLLGARSVDPSIVVEVQWIGFFRDLQPANGEGKFRETVFARQLIANGADVIAHNTDTGRAVEAVEEIRTAGNTGVYSVAYHNIDGCKRGPTGCIGAAYWNWGPSYIKAFEAIHKGKFKPGLERDNITTSPQASTIYFGVNGAVTGDEMVIAINEKLGALVADPYFSLKGPYCTNGANLREPNCVASGENISDDELEKMCWFVEGMVAKVDPINPSSADMPAQVGPECAVNQ